MAAAIRRLDPAVRCNTKVRSSIGLDAAAPVTDIVCPMYAPADDIAAWAAPRRTTDDH